LKAKHNRRKQSKQQNKRKETMPEVNPDTIAAAEFVEPLALEDSPDYVDELPPTPDEYDAALDEVEELQQKLDAANKVLKQNRLMLADTLEVLEMAGIPAAQPDGTPLTMADRVSAQVDQASDARVALENVRKGLRQIHREFKQNGDLEAARLVKELLQSSSHQATIIVISQEE
jgi:hypothetical protein